MFFVLRKQDAALGVWEHNASHPQPQIRWRTLAEIKGAATYRNYAVRPLLFSSVLQAQAYLQAHQLSPMHYDIISNHWWQRSMAENRQCWQLQHEW